MSYEIDRVYTYHLQKGRLVGTPRVSNWLPQVSEALEELEKCGWKAVHVQYKELPQPTELGCTAVFAEISKIKSMCGLMEVNDYVRKNGGKLISHVAMNRRTARISRSGVSHFDSEGTYHPPVLAKIED